MSLEDTESSQESLLEVKKFMLFTEKHPDVVKLIPTQKMIFERFEVRRKKGLTLKEVEILLSWREIPQVGVLRLKRIGKSVLSASFLVKDKEGFYLEIESGLFNQ